MSSAGASWRRRASWRRLWQGRWRRARRQRLVGRGGFEPPKVRTTRFTVWPIWPLWNLPSAYPHGPSRPPSSGRGPAHAARAGTMRRDQLQLRRGGRTGAGVPVPGPSADAAGPLPSSAQRESPVAGASQAVRRPREASAPVSSVRLSRFHGTARHRGAGESTTRATRRPGGSSRDRSCLEVFRAATAAALRAGVRGSRRWESNPQPPDYKSGALPIEPRRRLSTHGEARGRA